jgi:hypothetical protein
VRAPAIIAAVSVGIGALLLIIFVGPLRNELRLPIFPQDEGLLLVYPSLILQGAIPNHSFESVYGVVNLWILSAAFKLFGYSVAVERAVGIIYRFVVFASLIFLAWRYRGPLAALIAGLTCSVLMVGTFGLAAYSWFCALAFVGAGFVLTDLGLSGGMRRSMVGLGGIAFGLAVGARLDMGPAVILVLVVLVLCRRACLPSIAVGFVLGCIPLLINVLQAGPSAVVRDQILQPIFVSGPSRRLPLSTLTSKELVLLFLCVTIALGSIVVGFVLTRRHREDWIAVLLLSLGVFELGILPQAFQRSDTTHLAYVGCFVLPAAVIFPAVRLPFGTMVKRVNVLPVIVAAVYLVLAEPFFGSLYRAEFGIGGASTAVPMVKNDGRSVPIASAANILSLDSLLRELDARSTPGERVFVGPLDLRTANYNDTFIYFLLPYLDPGSYYLEMNPGVANGKSSQLGEDLQSDQFLILTNQYDDMFDPVPSTRNGSQMPNEIVSQQFRLIDSQGPWELFERTGRRY